MASTGNKSRGGRLQFIDFTRGLVMAIMAWDHVSGFWNRYHLGSEGVQGMMRQPLNTTWFLSRYVTHYCAPTFIFLAGTVLAYSTIKRQSRGDSELNISYRMIVRGIILLIAESLLVSTAFGSQTSWLYFGVIACIGVCFIIFSVARKLPTWLILTVSLIIVLNHSYLNLDFIPNDIWWGHYLRVIIHEPS
ncbi:MAG: heparan-alpha-glucosaminide N-acetyltransferase domain-containing protein, partial [Candidatus Bathyarchaeota archaeon]|nr:heparan-alpha-glucosaminide N-acetyltransferase domain-containing protein [Candidatus Bathyarchaeota archaeon]